MDISFIPSASAATTTLLDTTGTYTVADMLQTAVALMVLVGGLCAIIFIIWGGLMLILSGGKDEKVKPAINSIRYAVIGVIVIVIAVFVAPKVAQLLGLGQHEYLSPPNIFKTVQKLMGRIFGSSTSTYDDSPIEFDTTGF